MPLKGRIFDVDGLPMSPAFTHRRGKVYQYYVSAPLQKGRPVSQTPGAIRRVAAVEIEGLLVSELRQRFSAPFDKPLKDLLSCVERVELDAQAIRIKFKRATTPRAALVGAEPDIPNPHLAIVTLEIRCKLRGGRSWLEAPNGGGRTIRVRRDLALIKGLQQAHRLANGMGWRAGGNIENPKVMAAPVSAYDRKLCRLVFLAPDIQKNILSGRQPRDLTLLRLLNESIPVCWEAQREQFGFADRL